VSVEVVRRALEEWNRQATLSEETFREVAWPDMVLDVSANVFNPAVYEGLEGMRRWAGQVHDAWEHFRMEPEELIEQGDVVLALVRAVAKGRGSGVEIDIPSALICELREGRIAAMRVQPDREAALREIGR
jgi:ketosteroid isomerase-like protein